MENLKATTNDPAKNTCTIQLQSLYTEMQEAFRQNDEVAEFFELSPDLLCIANRTHFVRVSPSWSRVLGWSESELLSMPFLEIVHPDDRERTERENAEKAQEQGEVEHHKVRCRTKDGGYRAFTWSYKWNGDTCYAIGKDITDDTGGVPWHG
jgi:PAS domain S-box-containing protein